MKSWILMAALALNGGACEHAGEATSDAAGGDDELDAAPADAAAPDDAGLDAAGWVRQYGDTGSEVLTSMAALPSGLLVSGYYTGQGDVGGGPLPVPADVNAFITAYDVFGDEQWTVVVEPSAYAGPTRVAVGGDTIAVAGRASGSFDVGLGASGATQQSDLYVLALSLDGQPRWQQLLSSASDDTDGLDVSADDAGNVTIAGVMRADLTIDGTTLVKPDGDRVLFIARLAAADGSLLWSRILFDPGTSPAMFDLDVNADGDVFVVMALYLGTLERTFDLGCGPNQALGTHLMLARLDHAGGACEWSWMYGEIESNAVRIDVGDGDRFAASVQLQGPLDLGGGSTGPSTNTFYAAVFHGLDGSFDWGVPVLPVGVPQTLLTGLQLGANGELALFGHWGPGTIDLGAGPMTGAGNPNLFAVRRDPQGHVAVETMVPMSGDLNVALGALGDDGTIFFGTSFTGTAIAAEDDFFSHGEHDFLVEALP